MLAFLLKNRYSYSLFFLFFCFFFALPLVAQTGQSEIEKAEEYLKKVPFRNDASDTALVNRLNFLAFAYRDKDISKAMHCAVAATVLSEMTKYRYGEAKSLGLCGLMSYRQGHYSFAIDYHLRSLAIAEEIQDSTLISFRYNDLANIFLNKGDTEKAKIYNRKSFLIKEKIGDKEGIATSLRNFGHIYLRLHRYDSSEYYLAQAADLAQKIRHDRLLAYIYTYQGELFSAQKKHERAIRILEQARTLQINIQNWFGLAETQNTLAKACFEAKEYEKSLFYFNESLKIAQKKGLKHEAKTAYLGLSDTYQSLNNPALALINFKKYSDVRDSLFSEKSEEQIAYMEALFNNERKEVQISLLTNEQKLHEKELQNEKLYREIFLVVIIFMLLLIIIAFFVIRQNKKINAYLLIQKERLIFKNVEIEREKSEKEKQAAELHELNTVKNKLLTIISHDLRSPLGSLQGLLTLLSFEGITKDEFISMTDNLRHDVSNLNDMLNNLLAWAIEQSEGIQAKPLIFNIQEAIAENIALISPVAQNKEITIICENERDASIFADIDQIKLIIRNLLNNAVKFTARGGKIFIDFEEDDKEIALFVRDTGIGMTQEKLKNLFGSFEKTSYGTENEKGTGLGLKLCKDFAEKNNGSIHAESQKGKGSIFTLRIPKAL